MELKYRPILNLQGCKLNIYNNKDKQMDKITITQKYRDSIVINCKRDVNYRDTGLLEDRLPSTRKLIQINLELEEFKRSYPFVETLSKIKMTQLEHSQKETVGILQDLKFAILYLNIILYGRAEPPPPPPPPRISENSGSGSDSDTDSDEYVSPLEICFGDDPPFPIVQPIPLRTSSLVNVHKDDYSNSLSDSSSSSSEEPDNFYI
jgi:hypothetical protein